MGECSVCDFTFAPLICNVITVLCKNREHTAFVMTFLVFLEVPDAEKSNATSLLSGGRSRDGEGYETLKVKLVVRL